LPRLGPVVLSTYVCGIATVLLAGMSVLLEGARALSVLAVTQRVAVGYLALILTVGAFIAWYSAVGRLGVDRAGLFVGLVPVSALAGGVLLGTGSLSPTGLLGTVLVGGGVALGLGSNRAPATTTANPTPPTPLPTVGSRG